MTFAILGWALTVLGVISTGIGTFRAKNRENKIQEKLINAQEKNLALSDDLIRRTDDLLKPEILVSVHRELNNNQYLGAEINLKNTGGSNCQKVKLVYREHNSPLVNYFLPSEVKLLSRSQSATIFIPFFRDYRFPKITISDSLEREMETFYSAYAKGDKAVVVDFVIEYMWQGQTHLSKSYTLIKSIDMSVLYINTD